MTIQYNYSNDNIVTLIKRLFAQNALIVGTKAYIRTERTCITLWIDRDSIVTHKQPAVSYDIRLLANGLSTATGTMLLQTSPATQALSFTLTETDTSCLERIETLIMLANTVS